MISKAICCFSNKEDGDTNALSKSTTTTPVDWIALIKSIATSAASLETTVSSQLKHKSKSLRLRVSRSETSILFEGTNQDKSCHSSISSSTLVGFACKSASSSMTLDEEGARSICHGR